jgi:quercetin dioxygenase-like cupin family protein
MRGQREKERDDERASGLNLEGEKMMQTEMERAIIVPAGEGLDWNVLGTAMTCRISSEETDGAYSIVENRVAPQAGPPPHVHHNEDEIFHVLAGEFEIRCGDQTFNATAGAIAVLPRNIPHAFRNVGEAEGRLLVTITPGGFEQFFAEVSREVRTMPPDVEKLTALARKYELEFLM